MRVRALLSLLMLAVFLPAAALFAETPLLRVRLFTLFTLPEIVMTPERDAKIAWGAGAKPEPLDAAITLRARGDKIAAGGRITNKLFVAGTYRISATGAREQRVQLLTEISARHGEVFILAYFPLEEYVAAAVEGESAGQMPPEALKALAIASRTFALHFRGRHGTGGFDFFDTTQDQYLRTEISPKVRSAVTATAGELLWVRGSLLASYYHKDCGGRTESADSLWPGEGSSALVSHADGYCLRRAQPWRAVLTRTQMTEALRRSGIQLPTAWRKLAISTRSNSGRARLLRFDGTPVSASSFRTALGRAMGWNTLKSDLYEISQQGDSFAFTGRGAGHGVGLCQTGAAEMASEGKSYREILAFYYPGAQVGRTAQGVVWHTLVGKEYDLKAADDVGLRRLAAVVAQAWQQMQQRSGLSVTTHPEIAIYPTVAIFRDSTGEPGWVAASTRDNKVRLQPAALLGEHLEETLRHELLHLAIEENAASGLPLWFREGLVLYFNGEAPASDATGMTPRQIDEAIAGRRSLAEQRRAYAAANRLVASLDRRYGRAQLLTWLRKGLPQGFATGASLPETK